MYEHIRANLAKDIAAAQDRVTQAIADRDQAAAALAAEQAALPAFQAAVAAAETTLAARNADVAAAQAVVDQRTAARDDAQADLDDAQRAFDDNGGDEPPFFDNPEDLRRWHELHDLLKAAIETARAARDAAQDQLNAAIAGRSAAQSVADGAAAALAQARDRFAAQNAAVAAARDRLASAEQAIVVARADVDALEAKIPELDRREATLTAAPLDRPSLERAADLEEADLQAGWQQRRSLYERRVQFRDARAASLAAHDTTVDEMAVLRSRIAGWPDASAFPGLGAVLTGLGSVIADNAAQRSRPPLERTDDLGALHDRLTALMFALQDVTGVATTARNAAAQHLDGIRTQLNDHQQEGRP